MKSSLSFGLLLGPLALTASSSFLQPLPVRYGAPVRSTHNLLFRYRGGSSSSNEVATTELKSSSSSSNVIINGGAAATNQTETRVVSPAAVVTPALSSTPPKTGGAVPRQQVPPKQQLLQRSGIVAASCVLTWTMVQLLEVSTIQASSATGLAACFLFRRDPASTAAAFCGSFAGMSGHIVPSSSGGGGALSTILQIALLGLCNAVTYYWWTDHKVQIGKGGRLGTIAFLANLLYFVLRQGALATVVTDVLAVLKPSTAAALLLSSAAMWLQQRQRLPTATPPDQQQQQQIQVSTNKSISLPLGYIVTNLPKWVVLGSLLARLWATTTATQKLVPTVLTTFVTSLLVKKSPGVVFPVALAGLLGGTFLPAAYAAPVYMGAFLGMTGLAKFGLLQFWDASLLSTLLLQLGVLNGFGGKLGFLAFAGVNFAM